MKHKILAVLLIVVLALTAVLFVACDKAQTAEYCTVSVRCHTMGIDPTTHKSVPHYHSFKIVKGERFTLSQVFNSPPCTMLYGDVDYFALTLEDGITLYDERQAVENDITLNVVVLDCKKAVYVSVIAKSDRLKALCEENPPKEVSDSRHLYWGSTVLTSWNFTDENLAKILGLNVTDLQYQIVDDDRIYNSVEDLYDQFFDEYQHNTPAYNHESTTSFYTQNYRLECPHIRIWLL